MQWNPRWSRNLPVGVAVWPRPVGVGLAAASEGPVLPFSRLLPETSSPSAALVLLDRAAFSYRSRATRGHGGGPLVQNRVHAR